MKVICFGVRDTEKPIFNSCNSKYNYDLELCQEMLTASNHEKVKGYDAIIVRANCVCDENNLKRFKEYGIKYLLTRTVGYNHIDLEAAHKLNFSIAYVPAYSSNAIAELALGLGLSLLRNISYTTSKTSQGNFIVDNSMYAKEIRNSVVGIIGTGKIGLLTAKYYSALGAKVIAYGNFKLPQNEIDGILEYVELDELFKKSDLISIHTKYQKENNFHLINKESFEKMKDGVCIVNTARGELIDTEELYNALISNKVKAAALDVIENESAVFGKNNTDNIQIKKLNELYPRVIFTPHIGSYTDEAIKNMVEISYQNLFELSNNIDCKNKL